MARIVIFIISLYRKFISPLLPPACKFRPTCSEYAIEALQKHGFFKGSALAFWRILRCNPFSKGGYDPVPEPGRNNSRSLCDTGQLH
ncbi:MAG TPA: membrane protein insertion efficiency factor YidD [bacterium]|nr:membrane protein insertion efficiency factor YidD [bacterium]